jgi:hypothetical protein
MKSVNSFISSGSSNMNSVPSARVKPGRTALTRIGARPSSMAATLTNISSPAFAAA